MIRLFSTLLLLLCLHLNAQTTIHFNDIKAQIGNTGIHISGTDSQITVPKIKPYSFLYTSSLWLGGKDVLTDSLFLAAEAYRQRGFDYKPGPIDLITNTYNPSTAAFYDKKWEISKQIIDDFKTNRLKNGYVIPNEIKEWPAHGTGNFSYNLAPFVDTDNNGKYEPEKGDYPDIKGDYMLWWVFNDLGAHTETNSKAIGVEIHGSCYAYLNKLLNESDPDYIINRSLFFNYKVINRSKRNYKDFYAGIFNDIDLGDYVDDDFAFDSINNQIVAVNNDNFDNLFGANPPMMSCQFLNQKMNSIKYYLNNFNMVNGNPNTDQDYYYYLQGKNKNNTNDTLKVRQTPCDNPNNLNSDIRVLSSTRKGSLDKDSAFDLTFVYSVINDCNKAGNTAQKLKNWYVNDSFPSKSYWGLDVERNEIQSKNISVYPNPFNNLLNIDLLPGTETTQITLIDAFGKVILSQTITTNSEKIDVSKLSDGLYILKAQSNNNIYQFKLLKKQ